MDTEIGVLIMLVLGALVGAALGWVSFFQVRSLRTELRRLRRELHRMQQEPGPSPPPVSTPEPSVPAAPAHEPAAPDTELPEPEPWPPQYPGAPSAAEPGHPLLERLRESWMIWLGGISVALAGVFMVKYGIERGLLGPAARVLLGICTGLVLHSAAEWLRRRSGGSDPVFAALAGGASITLYAALLAALHLYHLLDPRLVFVLLALVSLLTMGLALLHGPELAIIGLIGAYVVPVLVSTGSSNIITALVYALIISAAGLLLLRYVFRHWLWWGILAGALGWWLISLGHFRAEGFRGIYLALLAWGMIAIPAFDLLLQDADSERVPGTHRIALLGRRVQLNQLGLVLVCLAWACSIYLQGFSMAAVWLWSPLVVVLGLAARQRDSLAFLPWLTLVLQWFAWLLASIRVGPDPYHFLLVELPLTEQTGFLTFAAIMSAIYAALGLLHVRVRGYAHGWASLSLLAPLAWLALAYLLVNGLSQSLHWSVLTFLAGTAYGTVAGILLQRQLTQGSAVWLTLGAHIAYSLAVTMYFREATLTLALSAQLLSLSWLMKRYQLPWLGYVVQLLLALIVIRLTFNPWLLSYPSDVHWSLWTYGGATLFSALAALQTRSSPRLQRWLEAVTLHLLVLTLAAEVRYWLYDGDIFAHRFSLTEAAINTSLWAGLALAYYLRSTVSEHLQGLYRLASHILLVMALASYASAALLHNPWWSQPVISSTPVFNLLLLAYGLPVIMALLVMRLHEPALRRPAAGVAGLALLLFTALEIRHLWQDGRLGLQYPTGDGELYSYSVAGLLLAIGAILGATRWRLADLYRAGLALLAVVIAKIFLVDMSGLEGLWRVASFMGLGLSLLGLAWLHRHMRGEAAQQDPTGSPR